MPAGDRNGIIALWLESFWDGVTAKQARFRVEGGKSIYWALYEPRVKRTLAASSPVDLTVTPSMFGSAHEKMRYLASEPCSISQRVVVTLTISSK